MKKNNRKIKKFGPQQGIQLQICIERGKWRSAKVVTVNQILKISYMPQE